MTDTLARSKDTQTQPQTIDEMMLEIRKLMNDHGLGNWHLWLEHNMYASARTNNGTHTIYMSEELLSLNSWSIVRDTAIHEMAHALDPNDPLETFDNGGHTANWRRIAKSLGADQVVDTADKYKGIKLGLTPKQMESEEYQTGLEMMQWHFMFGLENEKDRIKEYK